MRRAGLIIIFSLFFLTVGFSARAYYNPGKPAGFVNDYANLLTATEKSSLEAKISQFNQDSSNEISVVTIKSLNGDTVDNFAVKLFADWGIGKAKKDNGVLLLIALDEKKMRIEVGYGLEGALPDATAFQIITKTLRPAFQAGTYYNGINQAVDQIMAATRGEYQTEPAAGTKASFHWSLDAVFWLFMLAFWLLSAWRRHLAKSKSWWEGGVIGVTGGLIIALVFFRTLVWLIATPAILGAFGLFFDYLVSRVLPMPKPGKKGGGFWIFPGGFGGGSGGGFGGGFGGFGGGGSGGGGASGGW